MITLNDVLFSALVLLNFADLATTIRGLERGAQERNTLLARLFGWVGVEGVLFPLKAGVIGLVGWYQYKHSITDSWLLGILVAIYASVVLNNWREGKKQRKG